MSDEGRIKRQRILCNTHICGVCLADDLQTVSPNCRTQLECGHLFHTTCLDGVFSCDYISNNLCPVCRFVITDEIREDVHRKSRNIEQELLFLNDYPYTRETIPIPPGSFILTKQKFDLIIDKQSLVGATLSVYSSERGAQYENVHALHYRQVAENVLITEIYEEGVREEFRGPGFYYRYSGPHQPLLVPGSQRFDVERDIYVVTPLQMLFASIIESIPTYYIGNVPCSISGGKRKSSKRKARKRKSSKRKARKRRITCRGKTAKKIKC